MCALNRKKSKKSKASSKKSKPLRFFEKHKRILFWSIVGLFGFLLAWQPISDVDIWWHIAMGRGVLSTLGLPSAADFYWSPIAYDIPPDLRYTWLGDLIFALTHNIGGSFGLQLLALGAVGASIWLLWDMSGRAYDGRSLLILILFSAATYQMHIVRNALFGLPATVFLLWLWWKIHRKNATHLWWAFPMLLTAWSCLHGSYLFGFGLLILLIVGEVLDRIRNNHPIAPKDLIIRGMVLVLSYLGILIYNSFTIFLTQATLTFLADFPLWLLIGAGVFLLAVLILAIKLPTQHKPRVIGHTLIACMIAAMSLFLYKHFKPYFGDTAYLETLNLRAYQSQVDTASIGFFGRIKHGLNNTFWKSEAQQMASVDFLSPFDFAGDIYVWTSIIFLIFTTMLLCLKPNRQWVHILPFCAISFLGLGYLRTIGFIAIFGAYLWATTLEFRQHRVNQMGWVSAVALTLILLLGILGQFNPLGLNADHRLATGPATFFPKNLAETTLETYPDQLIFTTIENGGYILNTWYPHKKVFMDGFFRPHEGQTYLDYSQAQEMKDPDYLFERYGITLAIIGVRDSTWFDIFNSARGWIPRMADRGAVLFERNTLPEEDYQFECLMSEHEWDGAEPYLKRLIAIRLYDASFKLLSEGCMVQATQFIEADQPLMAKIRAAAPARVKDPFEKSVHHLKQQYGLSNNPFIRTEFRLSEAVQQGDTKTIFQLGEALVENQPERDDVWQALITTAEKLGQQQQADHYRLRRQQALATREDGDL